MSPHATASSTENDKTFIVGPCRTNSNSRQPSESFARPAASARTRRVGCRRNRRVNDNPSVAQLSLVALTADSATLQGPMHNRTRTTTTASRTSSWLRRFMHARRSQNSFYERVHPCPLTLSILSQPDALVLSEIGAACARKIKFAATLD